MHRVCLGVGCVRSHCLRVRVTLLGPTGFERALIGLGVAGFDHAWLKVHRVLIGLFDKFDRM